MPKVITYKVGNAGGTPCGWTREQVIEKIFEAIDDIDRDQALLDVFEVLGPRTLELKVYLALRAKRKKRDHRKARFEALKEGGRAYNIGRATATCPYRKPNDLRRLSWLKGWHNARLRWLKRLEAKGGKS